MRSCETLVFTVAAVYPRTQDSSVTYSLAASEVTAWI